MKNIMKIVAVVLAIAMCFTVFAVSAAESAEKVKLVAYYNEDATAVIVSVSTVEPMGAIEATFTSDIAFTDTETQVSLYDEGESVEKANQFKLSDDKKSVKFVLVTNDTTGDGDTNWAKFTFLINSNADTKYTFSLTGVKICTVGEKLENIEDNDITSVKISIDNAAALKTLGVQYRKATTEPVVSAAIRFGAKLDRNIEGNKIQVPNAENTGTIKAQALWCGYIHSWASALKTKNEWSELKDLELVVDPDTCAVSKKYFCKVDFAERAKEVTDTYLVYTLAAVDITSENENLDYVVRPFTIYRDENGKYGVIYGDQVFESFADVKNADTEL